MSDKIFLVKFIDHDTIEGYVRSKAEFYDWLEQHNKQRIKDGEEAEHEINFSLTEINSLKR